MAKSVTTLEWIGGADGYLRLLDQTRLPAEVAHVDRRDVETVFEAIRSLRVRGAPTPGIRVVSDPAVWSSAVAAWKAAHIVG